MGLPVGNGRERRGRGSKVCGNRRQGPAGLPSVVDCHAWAALNGWGRGIDSRRAARGCQGREMLGFPRV